MNDRRLRATLTGAVAVALLAGCAAPQPTSYYSLYEPAPAVAVSGGTLAVSIGPVTLPDLLRQARIATGDASRYRLAEHHRWSGELDRELARALAEQLAIDLGTEQVAVFPRDGHLMTAWRVLVDVLAMGGEPGRDATLEVRWTLLDPQRQRPAVARRSNFGEIPAETGYPAWVAAQRRNVAKLGGEIAAELRQAAGP